MRVLFVLLLSLLSIRVDAEIIELASGEQAFCYIAPGARYEWRENTLVPREGLFSYFSGSDRPLEPVVHNLQEAGRGTVFSILAAAPEALDFLTAVLLDGEHSPCARALGFPLESGPGIQVWSVLMGLGSELAGGDYSLRLEGGRGGRSFQLLSRLSIRAVDFGFEEIELSRGLGDLLTEDEERRYEEYRRLHELLLSSQPEALFHSGEFTLPLKESVPTAFYGDRRHYVFAGGEKTASVHQGIDLAAPAGTEVSACAAGRVVMAAERLVSGNSVVLEHLPGVYSLYFHLQEIRVREGEMIDQGRVLGSVGATGLATGAHLHWELRVSGVAVNPEHYLGRPLIDKSAVSSIMEEISNLERR
jgi:hypothetical protein